MFPETFDPLPCQKSVRRWRRRCRRRRRRRMRRRWRRRWRRRDGAQWPGCNQRFFFQFSSDPVHVDLKNHHFCPFSLRVGAKYSSGPGVNPAVDRESQLLLHHHVKHSSHQTLETV